MEASAVGHRVEGRDKQKDQDMNEHVSEEGIEMTNGPAIQSDNSISTIKAQIAIFWKNSHPWDNVGAIAAGQQGRGRDERKDQWMNNRSRKEETKTTIGPEIQS